MAEIVDAADVPARDDAVTAGREIDLLADHRHGAGILDQFRRKQRDHVERAPQNMALAAGEEITRLDRIINDRQTNIKTKLFGKDTLVVRLQAGIGHNDRRPAWPHIDRELDYEL